MTPSLMYLAGVPVTVLLVAVIGRTAVLLIHDVARIIITWMVLRGSSPEQRPAILRAFLGPAHSSSAAQASQREGQMRKQAARIRILPGPWKQNIES
jgi:hypothetical protein